jgi:protein-S-isoprenylcysteine O-methyltransferase Ste14
MDNVHLLIIIIFVLYFILHSVAASLAMKHWVAQNWPQFMPYYRLSFNALAILLALPLLGILILYPGEPLWQWQGLGFFISSCLALFALMGFFVSLTDYDLSEFWGTKQWREGNKTTHDQEGFHISTFHRYVRHPWYFFLLILLWTRDISTTQFTAYVLISLYLIIGSWFEERKLIAYHGEVYKEYQQKVAGLFPLPWKILTVSEAEALIEKYKVGRIEENA